MKLVFALKANAIPRRSRTKPTRVLCSRRRGTKGCLSHVRADLSEDITLLTNSCVCVTLASCSLKVFVLNIWATASNAAVRGSMNRSNRSSSSPAHKTRHHLSKVFHHRSRERVTPRRCVLTQINHEQAPQRRVEGGSTAHVAQVGLVVHAQKGEVLALVKHTHKQQSKTRAGV